MTTPADDAALAAGAIVEYAIDLPENPTDDAGASILDTYLPGDDLLTSQWYLKNSGSGYDINVETAWDDYTGKGVSVAVLDDGFDYLHSELAANYDTTRDIDVKNNDGDAFALSGNNHGTQVMGVIGAANDGVGTVGVAYDATLVGIRQGVGAAGSVAQISEAFASFDQFDVVSNSWTYTGYFFDNFDSLYFATISSELIDAVDNGRDGLGSIVVFSAGNSGGDGQNVNYHAFQNSPFTIAVGGMNTSGTPSSTSTPGAAILVAAPMNGIVTTDRSGGAGSTSTDYATVSGTSFSAPMVAGVTALMLEANSELGYRDVQEILAYSARNIDIQENRWDVNGADNWNGGGLTYNYTEGFGLVDAHAAVRLAETWTQQGTYDNRVEVTQTASPFLSIPSIGSVSDTITIGGNGVEIDHVLIDVAIIHPTQGELLITLTSPDGTSSVLVNTPGNGTSTANNIVFQLTSTNFWGESGVGDWTLTVEDTADASASGLLYNWGLTLLGDAVSDDDTYFYTGDWERYAPLDGSRQVLSDSAGNDTVSFATRIDDITFDLNAGSSNSLGGFGIAIDASTTIENAIGGDGNDTFTGNAADNSLRGMRGDDTFTGGEGNDTIDGGVGIDTAFFTGAFADYTASIDADGIVTVVDNVGSDGTDTLTGVEFLSFSDQLISTDGFVSVGDVTPPADPVDPPADPVDPPVDPVDTPADTVSETAPVLTYPVVTIAGTSSGLETLNGTSGNDVIDAGGGKYDVLNGGLGDDAYFLNNSSTVINDGAGEGNDTLYSSAKFYAAQAEIETAYMVGQASELRMTIGDNVVHGSDSDNTIRAGVGNDHLYGYLGNDTLFGEAGDDYLHGGSGVDTAVYKGASSDFTIEHNTDGSVTITDNVGDEGVDTLVGVEYASFSNTTIELVAGDTTPTDPVDPPPADPVDPPPSDPVDPPPSDPVDTPADPVSDSAPVPTIPLATVAGTASGREVLNGTTGNDVIDAGGGKYDVLNGGLGDDAYIINNSSTTISDGADEGNDTLYSSSKFYAAQAEIETAYMLDGAVELRMTAGDNVVYGTDLDNTIRGGVGNDQLFGYQGNDTLFGEADNDYLSGGLGNDTAVYKGNAANFSIVDNGDGTVTITDNVGDEGVDTLVDVEFAAFADGTVELTTTLGSGDPVDPPPADPVDPPPADPVDPPPADPVDPPPADPVDPPTDTIGDSAPNPTPPAATIAGTSSGLETLTGTSGNDVIDAGGGKYDVLNGGLGDDSYIINNSSTTISDGENEGNDTLYSSSKFYAAQAEIETAYMMGQAVELRMTIGDNVVHGSDIDNTIRGGVGNDQLYGYQGNDTLFGEADNDYLNGGLGSDTAVYKGNSSDFTIVDNGDGSFTVTDNTGGEGVDTLVGVEFAAFSDATVELTTTTGGSDPVDPPPADPVDPPPADPVDPPPADPVDPPPADPVDVDSDNAPNPTPPAATVSGTASGRELLTGTAGNDVIDAGGGKYDVLTGGLGDDVYIINNSSTTINDDGGNDTLYTASKFYAAQAEVETVFMIDGAVEFRGNAGDNVIYGTDNDNVIRGGVGNDQLFGFMGNDVLFGESGDDYINGGLGTDTAKYNGTFGEFSVLHNGDGSITVTDTVGDHGADTLVNVEFLEFNDQTVDLGVLFA